MQLSWRRLFDPRPKGREGVDAVVVVLLLGIALVGFQAVYGGSAFWFVGMGGVLIGMAVAYAGSRFGARGDIQIATVVVLYFLVGGLVALAPSGVAAAVPGPSSLATLAAVTVRGWKELLTTQPPVGSSMGLFALPFALGLFGGLATLVATRSKSLVLPVLAPTAILALGILFGSELPVDAILQGAVFGAVVLAWWTWRKIENRSAQHAQQSRLLMALGTVIVAVAVAPVVGPRLPFAHARSRVILSQYVNPPLNASDLSSPLAAFRVFTSGAPRSLASTALFRVQGLKPGALVQIATMDSYNGLVWGFSSEANSARSDAFVHFGSSIPEAVVGRQTSLTITVLHPFQAWLPDIGAPTRFHFLGKSANALATGLLLEPQTHTAADSALATSQDPVSYLLTTVIPKSPAEKSLIAASAGQSTVDADIPSSVQALAESWTQHASSPWQRVLLLAHTLKSRGRFSNGTGSPSLALPGESLGRLESFLSGGPLVGKQIVGDDEQFAATLGLMANAVGVPAEVVLGAQVPSGGVVTGRDIHAWVEVQLSGLGWVTVPPSQFLPTIPPVESKLIDHPTPLPQTPVAPPLSNTLKQPPTGLPSAASTPHEPPPSVPNFLRSLHLPKIVVEILEYIVLPLGIIGLIILVVGMAKFIQRRRRRLNREPMAAIAGGWRTLIDGALELRLVNEISGMTRGQVARMLPSPTPEAVATLADRWSFGPEQPTSAAVGEFWTHVDAARRELSRAVPLTRRVRAFFSFRSFYRRGRRTKP